MMNDLTKEILEAYRDDDLLGDLFGGDEYYFGLDFGTFRSMLAYTTKDGVPKTVVYDSPNENGIPSVFWRSPTGEEYVGDLAAAVNPEREDPEGVVTSIKMKLEENEIFLHNVSYRPRDIAVRLIRRIMEVSRDKLANEAIDMNLTRFTVGVPVSIPAMKRAEIEEIVRTATGCENIRLYQEPLLAKIACDRLTRKTGALRRPAVVCDVGAGTFDATMVVPDNSPNAPYPYKLCPGQDGADIAGDNFDEKMLDLLVKKIKACPESRGADLSVLERAGSASHTILLSEARMIKERLSLVETYPATVSIPGLPTFRFSVTRREYEAEIAPLVDRIVSITYSVMERAKLGAKPDIDVLLIGGSTYIPLIREKLAEKFSWLSPEKNIIRRFPEKAVALGAALFSTRPDELVNVAFKQGYTVRTFSTEQQRDMLCTIIPSDTASLPVTTQREFHPRYDNQSALDFQVYEVPSAAEGGLQEMHNGQALEYSLRHDFGRQVPKSTVVRLTTTLDRNGNLTMTVTDFGVSGKDTTKKFTLTNTRI